MTSSTSLRTLAFALSLCSMALPAAAESFPVRAKLSRPAYFISPDDPNQDCKDVGAVCLRQSDMRFGSQTVFVPAANQRVAVYMPRRNDVRGHQLCGVFFTDSQGRLNGNADCGGEVPVEFFLEIHGVSNRGFVVGTFNEDLFWTSATFISLAVAPVLAAAIPAIASGGGTLVTVLASAGIFPLPIVQLLEEGPDIFAWVSPVRRRLPPSTTMDFGALAIGGTPPADGRSASNGNWAAAVFEGVDFTYRALSLPTTTSKWIVNNYLFGAPTTIWGTVHINQSRGWEQAMGSIVHEMAHVVYNFRHSDENHYWGEVLEYASEHMECGTRRSLRFAQYEGFASAVRDVVWTNQEAGYRALRGEAGPAEVYLAPQHDCMGRAPFIRGLIDEGNVADFYATAISGIDDELLAPLTQSTRTGLVGLERYALLPLRSLFEMVSERGSGAHSVAQTWPSLAAKCGAVGPTPALCASERFRCYARNRLANPGDLPGTFWQDDCAPDSARVLASEPSRLTPEVTEVRLQVERVPYADEYFVLLSDTPGGAARERQPVTASNLTKVVSIDPCRSNWVRIETRATRFGAAVQLQEGPDFELRQTNPWLRCSWEMEMEERPGPIPFP